MYEVGAVAQFEAAHRLRGDFGPATRTHGHTYRVEAAACGGALRADGTLFDITILQRALQEAVAALHYRDLDELAAFQGRVTTAEAVARHIWDQIAPRLGGLGLETLSLRLWESPQAYALYEATLESAASGGQRR